MATLSELRNEIAVLVKQRVNGNLTTEIDQAINDAVDFHSARAFDFNEGFAQIPTVDGTPSYDLPDDLLMITHAQLFWGGSNFTDLIKRNWSWYLSINQDASQLRAVPSTYYAVREKKIYLYPTPSASPTRIDLYYTTKQAVLVGDDDENAFTINARSLIRTRAMYDLYLNRLQQKDLAANQAIYEADQLERLYRVASANLGQETSVPFEF